MEKMDKKREWDLYHVFVTEWRGFYNLVFEENHEGFQAFVLGSQNEEPEPVQESPSENDEEVRW